MKIVRRVLRWFRGLFIGEQKKQITNNRPEPRATKRQWRGFMNTARINGTVKFFDQGKGYGFIAMGAEDIFVHATRLRDGVVLDKGDKVLFTVGEGRRGPEAQDVELVKKAEREPRRERRNRGNDARI